MKKILLQITTVTFLFTVISAFVYYKTSLDVLLTIAISCGTTFYHFFMRLVVGHTVNFVLNNQVNYRHKWFQLRNCEEKLYTKWKVKVWKERLPTYDPSLFSLKKHSFHEIAQAMCQAEIVHELIVLFSFLPLLFSIPFGAFPVFFVTSVSAAAYDAIFVIIQRYNRPRIIRLAHRSKTRHKA